MTLHRPTTQTSKALWTTNPQNRCGHFIELVFNVLLNRLRQSRIGAIHSCRIAHKVVTSNEHLALKSDVRDFAKTTCVCVLGQSATLCAFALTGLG